MADRKFLIRFRSPELNDQHVLASRAQIEGDRLILFNAQGKLAALFSLDIVESWNEEEVSCSSGTTFTGW
jgi:hypothetical protein